MMEEQHDAETRKAQLKLFAGAMIPVAGIDLLAHGGLPGLAIGGVAAFLLAKHSPELREHLQEMFPTLPMPRMEGRSLKDRLLGVYPDETPGTIERDDEATGGYDEVEENGGDKLHLGANLRPHPNAVFSNRIAILGMPGAGKSNTVAVFAEELGQYEAPLVIFDQKPEYGPLCAYPYFARAFKANVRNVTAENAFSFGQHVMKDRLQVVLDLASYKDDDQAARVMIGIIRGAWAWEEERGNQDRIPCTFFLEEADYWLPQYENQAHVSKIKESDGRTLYAHLQQAFFDLIHRGRSFGLGIVVSTQRPANVDNRAIAVAEWKILLKANMPNDLKVYSAFGMDADMAMGLNKGEAYIIGPDFRGVFQIRKRNSPDEAQTPGLGNLQRKPATKEQIAHQSYASMTPVQPTSNIRAIRPDTERVQRQYDARYGTPVTVDEEPQIERETDEETPLRYARNGGPETASQEAVRAQNDAVNLPPGWDEKKLDMLPGFYRVLGLDKALIALELSTSQRNRDFAREALKNQGLWKEAK